MKTLKQHINEKLIINKGTKRNGSEKDVEGFNVDELFALTLSYFEDDESYSYYEIGIGDLKDYEWHNVKPSNDNSIMYDISKHSTYKGWATTITILFHPECNSGCVRLLNTIMNSSNENCPFTIEKMFSVMKLDIPEDFDKALNDRVKNTIYKLLKMPMRTIMKIIDSLIDSLK